MSITDAQRRILVSFSGGETSALMAIRMKRAVAYSGCEMVFVMANTGEEHEKSLEFADFVDRKYDLGLVWVESVIRHNERRGSGHRVTSFKDATRGVGLFESMAQKYGLPNASYPHCTRELKLNPIKSYIRSIGWEAGTYSTAIGIRSDELEIGRAHV